MTVEDLINKLNKYPNDSEVIILGEDSGSKTQAYSAVDVAGDTVAELSKGLYSFDIKRKSKLVGAVYLKL